jgi:hypothetical protein
MVKLNKKTGKSDFSPSEASDAKRKRRRIYRELDESMAKGRKFLDKETDKKGNLSQRAKNLQEAIIATRKTGEIADFGVKDIAEDLKTLKKGGPVKSKKKKNIKKSNNAKAITKKYFKGIF